MLIPTHHRDWHQYVYNNHESVAPHLKQSRRATPANEHPYSLHLSALVAISNIYLIAEPELTLQLIFVTMHASLNFHVAYAFSGKELHVLNK